MFSRMNACKLSQMINYLSFKSLLTIQMTQIKILKIETENPRIREQLTKTLWTLNVYTTKL